MGLIMELFVLKQGVFFHKSINFLLIFIIFINLAFLLINKNFILVLKIMWFFTPLIFGILAILVLSGFSILAMSGFTFSFYIFLMICVSFIIIFLEILRIKKLRIARVHPSKTTNYLRFSKILYSLYFCLILIFNLRF